LILNYLVASRGDEPGNDEKDDGGEHAAANLILVKSTLKKGRLQVTSTTVRSDVTLK
jgi:hypothetical protein